MDSCIFNSLHMSMAALLSAGSYCNIMSRLAFKSLRSVTALPSCSAGTSPSLSGSGYVFMHFRLKIGQRFTEGEEEDLVYCCVTCSCVSGDGGQDHTSLPVSGKKKQKKKLCDEE